MSAKGIDNFYIELIRVFPCNTREELLAEEGRTIRLHNTVSNGGNTKVAGRTKNEYYIDNHALKLAQRKAYRDANPEKVKACKKASAEANREKCKAYSHERYAANKEEISSAQKAYRVANLEKVRAQEKAGRKRQKEKRLADATAAAAVVIT